MSSVAAETSVATVAGSSGPTAAPAGTLLTPEGLVSRAKELLDQGLVADAVAQLQAALDRRPSDPQLLQDMAAAAQACGNPDLGARCWLALSRLEPWQPNWRAALAKTAVDQADYDRAYRIVQDALDTWPNDPTLRCLSVTYGSISGRSNSWRHDALALVADETMPPMARLHAARLLVGLGQTAAARNVLLGLAAQTDDDGIARTAAAELKAVELLEEVGDSVACAVPGHLGMGRPAVFHRAAGADVTAIVFVGLAGKVGVSVNVFHAVMAPLRVNIVYLYDEDRVTHLNGNRAFGKDYGETIEKLRAMLARWGTRRLVCIGNSAGGSAAIRYGLDLGAERILSFSGATTLDFEAIWNQGRARAVVRRMERMVPHMLTDLRPMLEQAEPAPRVDLYYGAEMMGDRAYAEHLADLPNVYLHPVAGSDNHAVVIELILLLDLKSIFAEALQGQPPDDAVSATR